MCFCGTNPAAGLGGIAVTTADHLNTLAGTEAGARLLFENAAQGILSIDHSGCIVDANPAALKMFGYSRDGLVGEAVETLLPESVRRKHSDLRAQYERNPHPRPMGIGMNLVGRRRDGSEFPAEISLSHLSVNGGYTVAFVADITQRHGAERERESLISQLHSALAEKTVLLKEVNHRVKNNLSVIGALLGMQADEVDSEQARQALGDSQQRVLSMALVQEFLYTGDHLDRINFGQYARQLAEQISAACSVDDRVRIEVKAEPIDLPVNRAIPCGLILNELVSNAFKHGFPGGRTGSITVRFSRRPEGDLLLSCEDDGVGIPEGVDWKNAHSLGLRIVQILVKQIEGKLTLDRPHRGTRFELSFPLQDRVRTAPPMERQPGAGSQETTE